jgi:myo-inositol-1(or 4)-monophosphatase
MITISINDNTEPVVIDALPLAQSLADEVAECLLGHFGNVQDAEVKGDGTLVTRADVEANHIIVDAIRKQYPEHNIISEELGTTYEGAPWCWIVDPLDGTTNFARGIPIWGVSIALAYEGWPVMGVIDLPALRIRYHAVKGGGAFETCTEPGRSDDNAIAVMPATVLADLKQEQNELVVLCSRTLRHFTLEIPMKPRILGSAAYDFCLTAAGVCLASIDMTPKVWDMAAGWLLVHEAGGVVIQLEGVPMFPLVAGQDYATIAHPLLSAPSAAIAGEIQRRMRRR